MIGMRHGSRVAAAACVAAVGSAFCGLAEAESYGAEVACSSQQVEGQYVCEAVVTRLDTDEPVMAPRIHARTGEEVVASSNFTGADGERTARVVVTVGDGTLEARIDVAGDGLVLFRSVVSLNVD